MKTSYTGKTAIRQITWVCLSVSRQAVAKNSPPDTIEPATPPTAVAAAEW